MQSMSSDVKPSGRPRRAHPIGPDRRRALQTVADRWTLWLLLAIDEQEGSIFSDFVDEPGLSRRVLAARLQLLMGEGLVERRQYQARPPRYLYLLTPRGEQVRRLGLALVHVAAGGTLVGDPLAATAPPNRAASAATADEAGEAANPVDALLTSDLDAARAIYEQAIAPLVRYDSQYRTSLVETLATWFACDASVSMAAAKLFAHRHTVRYRLARVRELTGLDSADAEDRERLALGLRAMRLLDVDA
jgi:DNA-binding HxlR family transcriptional regulator